MAKLLLKDTGVTQAEVDAELAKCEREAQAEVVAGAVKSAPKRALRSNGYSADDVRVLAEAVAPSYTVKLGTPCRFPGCSRPSRQRGLCTTHRDAAVRYGFVGRMGECSVEGCERAAVTRGLCPNHYEHWRAYGREGVPTCRRDGCEGIATKRGLCHCCYMKAYHRVRLGLAKWEDFE